MILGRGLRILEAPGVDFIDFGSRFGCLWGAFLILGGLLDGIGASLKLLGGSLGIPGSSKDGFSLILGIILEVLGR